MKASQLIDASADSCMKLLIWLRKCWNTFRFCGGLSHELLLYHLPLHRRTVADSLQPYDSGAIPHYQSRLPIAFSRHRLPRRAIWTYIANVQRDPQRGCIPRNGCRWIGRRPRTTWATRLGAWGSGRAGERDNAAGRGAQSIPIGLGGLSGGPGGSIRCLVRNSAEINR